MLSYRVKSKIIFFVFVIISVTLVFFTVIKSLEENVVYFFSPTEIYEKENVSFSKKIRVGGLVKENSIVKKKNSINFVITDLNNEIFVTFSGLVPNLFSEGKGVVAEGKLQDKKYFIAEKILAKHDENYMPREVSKILNKNKK